MFEEKVMGEDGTSLVGDCNIYNSEELKAEHGIECEKNSELLLELFNKIGFFNGLKKLDGVYSLCYEMKDKMYLCRDLLGVKPLWYCEEPFCFASERRELIKHSEQVLELNPRRVLVFNKKEESVDLIKRRFFELEEEYDLGEKELVKLVKKCLINSVKKRVPEDVKIGLLFSGGIDSTILALILKRLGVNFTCYTSGVKGSKDVEWSEKVAKVHDLNLKKSLFTEDMVKEDLDKICSIIESNNVVKVGVSVPFYYASKQANKEGVKVLFSGLGSEELFAGYNRFEGVEEVNKECLNGLKSLFHRDLYRDNMITKHNSISLRLPFLDHELVKESLRIPKEHKINEEFKKIILRKTGRVLEVDESVVCRRKKAAQYGSDSDKIIEKLSKSYKSKSDFLRNVYPHNMKLGALFSSGKDSNLTIHIMKRRNYDIKCLITMLPDKGDSYMFHQPVKELVELQSKSMKVPVVFGRTQGVKEEELSDLKKLIKKAKEEYKITGVVTGALFSNYQKSRVERVCDDLGLKTFNPLWNKNQEVELKQLLHEGFEFIFTKVACLGLDKSWLNRVITLEDVEELMELNKEYGVNVAGEGGEYESFVLNAPFYNKKLKIIKSEVVVEDDNTAELIIHEAELV